MTKKYHKLYSFIDKKHKDDILDLIPIIFT